MEVTWSIAQLERNAADGGVFTAHWRAVGSETVEDETFSASAYGTVSFTPDPTAEGFVPYENLTEADVIAWVRAALDPDSISASLQSQIDEKKAPATLTGMPWVNEAP